MQAHAEAHGYGVVRELIGHGIGRDMHEPPDVPNFVGGGFGRGVRLTPGMTIAVEPMINLGGREVLQKSDGWTVVVGTEGAEYLLLADGKRRKAQTPKRKKRRHIRATAYRIDPALFGDNAADAHLRKALRQLEENHDTDF